MGRILAVDYGRKRVGLAVTDPLQLISGALATIEEREACRYIAEYCTKNEVDRIVVGLPRQMNGEYSESFQYIEPFVERLRKGLPTMEVVYYDERFTSRLAMQTMIAGGVKKSDRRDKALVDRISATIILQSYMESIELK